ncbi:MAG: hypothetical protein GOMPHAMPRED_005817 [Gomphillus americanus]|uniref:Enhancer of mRNA-decapping protein 3 n=1 Tax=Gomphillus americanus TaxID=1940652 RepID=A0A8H3FXX4_9LECA|nr:MAG: hypothetical protein GOMPHAMPRED_005817 [Gomphillus americanus]
MPNFEIQGDTLLDLEVISSDQEDFRPSPLVSTPSPNPAVTEMNMQQTAEFVDPAILSMGRPPPRAVTRADANVSATFTDPLLDLSVGFDKSGTSELDTIERTGGTTSVPMITQPAQVSSPVQQAFKDLMSRTLHHNTKDGLFISTHSTGTTSVDRVGAGKQAAMEETRRSVKSRGRKPRTSTGSDLLRVDEPMPRKSKKNTNPKHTARTSEAQNGWATEEATDIQELGEFDFAANLSKFNKREIFKQLKEDDTTAPGDRLVGHNRLPKPGTNGGRNLHWTENVLDSPTEDNGLWNSEAGETADDLEQAIESGRSSTRQKSHSRTRLVATRKGSHNVEDTVRRQSQVTIRQTPFENAASPRIGSRKNFASPYIGSSGNAPRSSLRIMESNRICPTISPIQMLELEQYAIADLGLSEDILSENAARGIAELAIQLHSTEAQASPSETRVVVAVGNHKTGARTLAAARHLRNRGFEIICAIMGREEEFPDTIKNQASSFSKAGGRLIKPMELTAEFNTGHKPTLLIDALTGMHTSFDDLRREDQQWCFELAIWTKRLSTPVLSVDVPSGVDPSTGTMSTADGHTLAFRPDVILALGAPKPYLLPYLEETKPPPKAYIADIALGKNAWKRIGGKRRQGVDFGSKWLVELKLERGDEP